LALFHITNAAGRYVDRFVLIGEVLALIGFVVYFFTHWLDPYRERLFFALLLLLGVVSILHGARCRAKVWAIIGFSAGAIIIVTTVLYATSAEVLIQEYAPLGLGIATLLALVPLVIGRTEKE